MSLSDQNRALIERTFGGVSASIGIDQVQRLLDAARAEGPEPQTIPLGAKQAAIEALEPFAIALEHFKDPRPYLLLESFHRAAEALAMLRAEGRPSPEGENRPRACYPDGSPMHADDCQSHIVDVRGVPEECTCGLDGPALSTPSPERAALLQDANVVHINMLRGGIAKLTPAQIGHLYRGDEAAEVIREVARQNPGAEGATAGEVEEEEALREQPMRLEIALDFNDNPQDYDTLRCPADSKAELREALRVVTEAYRAALSQPSPEAGREEPYQARVHKWVAHCFGAEVAADGRERNHRFLEEALELVQATGCTESEAHQLVDYVFGRDVGDPGQEVGGVMNTLAALCNAHGLDLEAEAEKELGRVWTISDRIRAKHAAKPKHSPLPGSVPALSPPAPEPDLFAGNAKKPEPGYEAEPVAWTNKLGLDKLKTEPMEASWMWGLPNGSIKIPLYASPVPVAISREEIGRIVDMCEQAIVEQTSGKYSHDIAPSMFAQIAHEANSILQRLSNQQGEGKGPIPELPGVSAVQQPASSTAQHFSGEANLSDGSGA